jgi:uncharacterized protein
MRISLARLPEAGLPFAHQYQAGELDVSAHEFVLRRPPLVQGRATREGIDVRVRGQLAAELEIPCDRCLQDTVINVAQPFDLFYMQYDPQTASSSERELHERDLGFSTYEDDLLDLDQLVREQLELSLPARVLCRSDCRGLCPQCGADLNTEQCQCAQPVDPRWQALADLMKEN